ncbi:hypothetical protein PL263_03485 [Methylomonas sp. EFPC3]|uniref:hypothetical protein n=1 Tax=Methylomonas sp. EFPC3 TaxID=3021710 RepID=UPI002417A035|nr:hypothetical protein [Methylomonas sp. EFPC3]WFP51093.1 hypothetical protein PL263_03485 [Methylomonas sp. EFPC3]
MKKLVLGVAIAATLSSAGAQAAWTFGPTGVPVINSATTYTVHLSGASAAEKFLEKLFTDATIADSEQICDTTKPIWKFQDPAATEQYAYLCERAPANTSLPTGKANILIYKRSAGGSAFGVSPIVAEANGDTAGASIEFLKISSSTTFANGGCDVVSNPVAGTSSSNGTLGVVKCAYDPANPARHEKKIPDFGVSDVDPGQFKGVNAPIDPATGSPYPDVSTDDVSKLTVKAAAAVAFGVPVTKGLYFTLQAAQKVTGQVPSTCAVGDETEACMPSLTSAQVASIHGGQLSDWNQLKVGTQGLYDWAVAQGTLTAYLPAAGKSFLHTCRRENGSGTQAQSNIKFLSNPCNPSALVPAGDAAVVGAAEGDGYPMVHENSTSGRVDECLNELNDGVNNLGTAFNNTFGKRWAVGIQSLEKSTTTSSKYRFVKVDGVAPKLANVVNGRYKDWAENTFQYWPSHAFESLPLVDALIKSAASPTVMSKLNTFSQTFHNASAPVSEKGAFLAVPTNYAPEANGVYSFSRPVNPYTHATTSAGADACRLPSVYNDSASALGDSQL